jgi:hypothetical protein
MMSGMRVFATLGSGSRGAVRGDEHSIRDGGKRHLHHAPGRRFRAMP